MRKKKGFTLVELLVVMAIISILAAIAIPNVQKWIQKSKATSAIAEISNMELAITKLLADAGRSSLTDLMDISVLNEVVEAAHGSLPVGATIKDWDSDAFDFAVEYYTDAIYALLRVGRGALSSPVNLVGPVSGDDLLREDVVRTLGTAYMSELARDPWNNLYQFYPGPWSVTDGLNPFRTYLPPAGGVPTLPGDSAAAVSGDELSLGSASLSAVVLTDIATGDDIPLVGVPAINQMDVYIWSKGANLESGQALFDSTGYLATNGIANYPGGQEPEFMGGGDDINNWDRTQTFMQFYN